MVLEHITKTVVTKKCIIKLQNLPKIKPTKWRSEKIRPNSRRLVAVELDPKPAMLLFLLKNFSIGRLR